MKNLSFNKLLMIFGGMLFFVIIVTVVAVQLSSNKSNRQKIVKKTNTATFNKTEEDILSLQLEKEREKTRLLQEERAALENKINELTVSFQTVTAKNNQDIAANLASLTQHLEQLSFRLDELEADFNRVNVIRPTRNKEASSTPASRQASSDLYKVQAVVGKRAWIAIDDKEESVTVGDRLPKKGSKLQVRDVDSTRGNLIITPSN